MSLNSKCYISIATLKRAELGKPVSRRTLNKLLTFFDIEPEALLEADGLPGCKAALDFTPMLQPIVINWDLLRTLPATQEHEYLNYICSELHESLLKLKSDEMLCKIFSHQGK
ncbi:hypothetical protein [Enterobacter sp. Cy-643]|uniref:hypothetical protein n=1 Tax=Enterobacter sp. Cy-643 TaxID=2608346 RepID=UPI002571250C|nr:hypothetical protein [Enterobacter sp. Cy-643]